MSINASEVTTIYTALNASANTTLDAQWDKQRLRGADYANVVAQTITALIQTAASMVTADAQLAEQARQFGLQHSQQATLEANKLAEQARQFDANLAADAPVKTAQKTMIDNQAATELEKALLTARQASMYDDNLRVEEAKALKDVVSMMGVGGTAFSTATDGSKTVLNTMYTAIDNITS